ncbi:MAG: hypothetical protein U0031_15290 [Thermomicrobiales bacterium]
MSPSIALSRGRFIMVGTDRHADQAGNNQRDNGGSPRLASGHQSGDAIESVVVHRGRSLCQRT